MQYYSFGEVFLLFLCIYYIDILLCADIVAWMVTFIVYVYVITQN